MATVIDHHVMYANDDWKMVNFIELRQEIADLMADIWDEESDIKIGLRSGIAFAARRLGLNAYDLGAAERKRRRENG